ncbi:MAG: fasciclin domain-containing protein [Bacteroidota bacterium]
MKISFKSNVIAVCAVAAISLFTVGCSKEEATDPNSSAVTSEMASRNGAPAPGAQPIAQIAIDAGFTELVSALVYVDNSLNTGLVDMFMNGTDQYTVFAPTNAAFQNLYTALNITQISDLPAELVRDVLLYHVVDGRRAANSVVPSRGVRNISTLLESASFTVNPQGQITAVGNTASITTANISASNGIIHVIDAVILPIQ